MIEITHGHDPDIGFEPSPASIRASCREVSPNSGLLTPFPLVYRTWWQGRVRTARQPKGAWNAFSAMAFHQVHQISPSFLRNEDCVIRRNKPLGLFLRPST